MKTEEYITMVNQKYGASLHHYAASIVGYSTADDILQETLLKLMLQYDKNKIREDVPTSFYYRVVHNLCIDYIRKNRKNYIVNDVEQLENFSDKRDSPDIEMRKKYFLALLKTELMAVDASGQLYTILILSQNKELTQIDIAKILGKSTATIRRKLQQTKDLIVQVLTKNGVNTDFFD